MKITAIHNSQSMEYRKPFGAVECGTVVTLCICVLEEVESVSIRLWYDNSEHVYPMIKNNSIYSIDVEMPENPMLVWYSFIIKSGDKYFHYGRGERLGAEGKLYDYQPESFQITVYSKGFETPQWFCDGIMYQIFVDRFYNGNEDGYVFKKRKDYQILPWGSPVPYDKDWSNSEFAKNDFYGGNLKGIIKKLNYLSDLGVSVLYLNPIFDAYSNHKYDTGDYMKIDDMFGDEEIFKELCEKAAEKGISIILDGVFSHTGIDSVYFNKRGNYNSVGAFQSKKSQYFDWYNFEKHPNDYECWWGVTTLPNVNEMTNSFREFILNDKNSVVKHWIKCGARGWRLDVADELPDRFIKEFRKAVKGVDQQAVIIGEVWEDASNKVSYDVQREFLLGEELDSVMNYPYKDGIIGYIMGWHSAEYFNKIVMRIYENYPKSSFYSLMNLIDSHDIVRAKTLFGNAPDIPMEKRAEYKLPYEKEILANKRMRIASLWQMTFPGVPCIYYGDEIGMQGYRDPFNRASFSWDDIDIRLLEWYRKLARIRNSFAPLRTGDYKAIIAEEEIFCYKREIKGGYDSLGRKQENGAAFVVINRSEINSHKVMIDTGKHKNLCNPITNEEAEEVCGGLEIMVPPISGALYVSENLVHR